MLAMVEGNTTEVAAAALLLVITGSGWLADTEAPLDKDPVVEGAVTRMVIVAVLLIPRLPTLHVIVLVPLQVPWLVVTETKVTPEGNVFVATTPVAADGPLLVTVTV
jgi:hypothetical protein